jgi:hypothetical protein
MRSLKWVVMACVILALIVAACGGENDKNNNDDTPATEAAAPDLSTGPDLATGPDLGSGGAEATSENQMPGCSDPDSTDCPIPLEMDLDATASAGGVTVSYPDRYFDATTANDGVLITITPSENNRYDQRAEFEIYFADSVEDALAGLTDPITGDWSNDMLDGTVGVVLDDTQDPPLNTSIGAFNLADGRTIVMKATTTGQYGWDLWSQVYEDMLNTLVVAAAD